MDRLPLRRAWPRCKTLGELVDLADAVPAGAIMPMVMTELHELARLQRAGQIGSATAQRHAIVTGALVSGCASRCTGYPKSADRWCRPRDFINHPRRTIRAMRIRATLARALTALRRRGPVEVIGFYPAIAGGPDQAARMLSDSQDTARTGAVLLAIGISCAFVLLFVGLATRFREVGLTSRCRVFIQQRFDWARGNWRSLAFATLSVLAASWLVIDSVPKVARLYQAHARCGSWTASCSR